MKIVHINALDTGGGAAIAACRHVEAMLHNGHEAKLLVRSNRSERPYVQSLCFGMRGILKLLYANIHRQLTKKIRPNGIFSVMHYGHPFHKDEDVRNADVIFLHWISVNTLSIKGVEEILKLGKPTFWFMHDMNPFTGGCHYAMDCQGYTSQCEDCPMVNNPKYKSITARLLAEKKSSWKKYSNLVFLAPSTWLAECASNSKVCMGHDVKVFRNFLNTSTYKPLDKSTKALFGLNEKKHTILIGAADLSSIYKGGSYIHDCLTLLDPERYEVMVIGQAQDDFVRGLRIKVVSTGFISDEVKIVEAYNACDVFLISSVAENYPNMVVEAMACGKPCVGVPCGGIPDIIKDGENGFVTAEHSGRLLKEAVEQVFSSPDVYEQLSRNARTSILSNNSYGVAEKSLREILAQ